MPAYKTPIFSMRFLPIFFIPIIALADDEPAFLSTLQKTDGLEARIFAGVDNVVNPVAMDVDPAGRVWLAETNRFRAGGVDDLRDQDYYFDDDMQANTIAEREAMIRKWAGKGKRPFEFYTSASEQIAVLEDTDRDGRADTRKVFAEGFDSAVSGAMAGIIVEGKDVYVTCIPALTKLTDEDGDLTADSSEDLLTGFGVRFSFVGHDLHGLLRGPDGRLYFSLGDRGFNVETKEGTNLAAQYEGGVFRCWSDGSGLELYHHGLRNPQELAFDDYGNLFTCDNNGDMGDKARIVYVNEGGDTGWHAGWQVHQTFSTQAGMVEKKLNPWMEEKMSQPYLGKDGGQPAYLTPPIANFGSGPSGFAFDPGPGSGLPRSLRGNFLVCDYTAGANSGIRHFTLAPEGSGFSLASKGKLIWGAAVSDVSFGYDGQIFASDYVGGWHKDPRQKGRILAMKFPQAASDPDLAELAGSDFSVKPPSTLTGLLSHADRRIRLHAQFALADKSDPAPFLEVLTDTQKPLLARLHALWGLGQLRHDISSSLRDESPVIRAAAARLVGDLRISTANPDLIALLKDPDHHVRAMAAIALYHVGDSSATAAALDLIEDNADRDPWLRHAGVMALIGSAGTDVDSIAALANHRHSSVRLAACVALRRLASPKIATFLGDPDTSIVNEAAIAIYDKQIPTALASLAAMIKYASALPALTQHRIVRAHGRLRTSGSGYALASYAANPEAPEAIRLEALEVLADWKRPHPVDRITAKWWPLTIKEQPPASEVADQLLSMISDQEVPGKIRAAAIDLATRYRVKLGDDTLKSIASDPSTDAPSRIEALRQLSLSLEPADLEALARPLLDGENQDVKIAVFTILGESAFPEIQALLSTPLAPENVRLHQSAIRLIGSFSTDEASTFLKEKLTSISDLPVALHLDILEACAVSEDPEVTAALKSYFESQKGKPLTEQHAYALEGGDPASGKTVFTSHAAAQCTRCHKIDGSGGVAGPDLSDVALRQDYTTLLQSVVEPGAVVAKGYGLATVTLASGEILAGTIPEESDTEISLMVLGADPSTPIRKIPVSEIAARTPPVSSMPPMASLLTPEELRDLIAYLKTRKTAPTPVH